CKYFHCEIFCVVRRWLRGIRLNTAVFLTRRSTCENRDLNRQWVSLKGFMRCSICRCKSQKAIELSLGRGITQAKVAAKYRVSASSLARHARNCMRSRAVREVEKDLRRVDRAIVAALGKNAGANIASMLN